QVGVRRRGEEVGDVVVVAQLGRLHAPATPALGAEGVGRHRLHVAVAAEGDDEVLVVDEVLEVDVARVEGYLCPPRGGEFLADLCYSTIDDTAQLRAAAKVCHELGEILA